MIPYASCNGADHTPFPGTSRSAAPGVARQVHNAGPREATGRCPTPPRQARTYPPSEHTPRWLDLGGIKSLTDSLEPALERMICAAHVGWHPSRNSTRR